MVAERSRAAGRMGDGGMTFHYHTDYNGSGVHLVYRGDTQANGHMWPQVNTDAFNLWALRTLASHPKRSSPDWFVLTPPPAGYACRLGRYTDHYGP